MLPKLDPTIWQVDLYLTVLIVIVLLADLILPRTARSAKAALATVGLLLGLVPIGLLWSSPPVTTFSGAYVLDPYGLFFKALFFIGGALVGLLSSEYFRSLARGYGEYFFLVIVVVLGCSLLASANDLIVAYIAFEMISLSSYVLAGYLRFQRRSNEAGVKYFLYGAAASAVMLYGFSWLYGLNLSTRLPALLGSAAVGGSPAGAVALALILVGLGYKVAMAPFQAWVPDVYEGAPTPVTAFLSVAPKLAGFAFLMRLLLSAGALLLPTWPAVIAVLAVLTMFAGNLMAVRQANIKRMLAYSSIAHAGYMLIGVVIFSAGSFNLAAVLYYAAAYLVMNLGAFAVAILLERNTGRELISDYGGLAKSQPGLALAMAIFLLSLIGIPPTCGFTGKLLVFGAALNTPPWAWLAVVGILNAAISVYYYLNVVREMYFGPGAPRPLAVWPWGVRVTIAALCVATLVLGLVPNLITPVISGLGQFLYGG